MTFVATVLMLSANGMQKAGFERTPEERIADAELQWELCVARTVARLDGLTPERAADQAMSYCAEVRMDLAARPVKDESEAAQGEATAIVGEMEPSGEILIEGMNRVLAAQDHWIDCSFEKATRIGANRSISAEDTASASVDGCFSESGAFYQAVKDHWMDVDAPDSEADAVFEDRRRDLIRGLTALIVEARANMRP